MRIDIHISYHSVKIDKVLETDNGEILHRVFPSGALRHEAWLVELEAEIQSQILAQIENLESLACTQRGLAA